MSRYMGNWYKYQLTHWMKKDKLPPFIVTLKDTEYMIKRRKSKAGIRLKRLKSQKGRHLYAVFTKGQEITKNEKENKTIGYLSNYELIMPASIKKRGGISLFRWLKQ